MSYYILLYAYMRTLLIMVNDVGKQNNIYARTHTHTHQREACYRNAIYTHLSPHILLALQFLCVCVCACVVV